MVSSLHWIRFDGGEPQFRTFFSGQLRVLKCCFVHICWNELNCSEFCFKKSIKPPWGAGDPWRHCRFAFGDRLGWGVPKGLGWVPASRGWGDRWDDGCFVSWVTTTWDFLSLASFFGTWIFGRFLDADFWMGQPKFLSAMENPKVIYKDFPPGRLCRIQ